MARDSFALRIARSSVPIPPPDPEYRVEFRGYAPLGLWLGAMIGQLLGPVAAFAWRWHEGWPDRKGDWLFLVWVSGGVAVCGALGWWCGRAKDGGRAIVFDAEAIRLIRPHRLPIVLLLAGLRRRDGRIPALVAPSGEAFEIEREGWSRTLDALYLRALIDALPAADPKPPRPSWHYAVFAAGCGIALALAFPHIRPPLDAEGSNILPPERLISMIVGTFSLVGLMLSSLIPLSRKSEKEALRPIEPNAFAAHFRSHRFAPPLAELSDGTLFRPVDEPFFASMAKEQRSAFVTLSVLFIAMGAACFTVTYLPNRRPQDVLTGRAIGGVCALFPLVLLMIPNRPKLRRDVCLRREGDLLRVFAPGGTETTYPLPASKTNTPTALGDWTDEFRDGKRRLRIDRRLLVPAEPVIGGDGGG